MSVKTKTKFIWVHDEKLRVFILEFKMQTFTWLACIEHNPRHAQYNTHLILFVRK